MSAGPLAGVRVLDASRFIAGPYAGQLLGYLGAEVIKIEEPGAGDPMRDLSKFGEPGMSAHFLAGNACKKSLTLNLKTARGREIFLDLVKQSDVVIENFKHGVMARLGLGHEVLRAANPRLVYAAVTGFGQTGPWRDWAAYDLIAQAAGGGMSITGWPGERPVKMGAPIGDLGAGVFAALGVLAALQARERTGRGDFVDVAMMDVQLSLLNYHAHYFWLSGQEPQAEGDAHPNIAPYQAFDTKTGPLVVAVYGDPFWPGFCRALEAETLASDPRYRTNTLRMANKATLLPQVQAVLAGRPRDHWIERLVREGVPAAPLFTVGQALDSAQAGAREMSVEAGDREGERFRLLGNPVKLASWTAPPTAPPRLGADTGEVLGSLLGLSAGDVAALRAEGIV